MDSQLQWTIKSSFEKAINDIAETTVPRDLCMITFIRYSSRHLLPQALWNIGIVDALSKYLDFISIFIRLVAQFQPDIIGACPIARLKKETGVA